ncbi:MAG TPA: C25 family cysteine peptidase [Ignavibacteria bacterium]|nr:C25 family cysteine peptidase [Ignavibacteria bacterium]
MKICTKIFIVVFVYILFLNVTFSQNYNWITPGNTYLKMYVIDNGMHRITKSDFTGAGISVTGIDPRTIKVLNKGTQVPLFFKGESDGVFNDTDYFDFYGTRNYGGLTNTYDQANNIMYVTDEYYNLYSDTNIYWVEWNGANGLRYSNSGFSSGSNFANNYFYEVFHSEYDKYYFQGENVSANDYRFLTNEKFLGEGWFWKSLQNTEVLTDTFSSPGLYTNAPQTSSLKFFAYPTVRNVAFLNEHSLEIRINGNLISTIQKNDFNRFDTTVSFSSSLLSNTSVNTVTFKYNYVIDPLTGVSSNLNFDFYEIRYPGSFRILNEKLSYNTGFADTTSKQYSITGYNSSNPINIYDVSNNFKISPTSSNADTLKFTGKNNGKFEIVNKNIINKPFRFKQRTVPNLVTSTNGADYLLIYNNLFSSQAEQLRSYRASRDNYRSVKAEIEDIYDIFNYGLENPVAVKNFTTNIYQNWQLPKLKFICLLGRGSYDPKKNMQSSIYYKNLVPVYGYPNSDGYFGNVNTGTFFYYDQIPTGRLPAYTTNEAQIMVDKIIAYENEPPAPWWKTFTYITGGGTFPEQQSHQQRSNFEISTYITSPPISGEEVKIYRNDASGSQTYNIADSLVNTINRGTLFVNFRGHAGSHDWEVIMNDPNTLNNGNKLPLILSLTCFTGENAKADYRGFGERFLYLGGKGAIGFVGTTGWSFGSTGNDFGTYIIQSLRNDSTRRIGDFLKVAGKTMSIDSLSFNVRHTINSYNLLGDPAAKLDLPVYPEFVIENNDYKISDPAPDLNDPVTLTIFPKNYGLYADTCLIRFQLKKNNQNYSFKDTLYRAFKFTDTIKYNFILDSAGIYDMVVTLDINNRYNREIETNNSITINLPTKNNTFIPISPVNNSVTYKDSVEFKGLNPNFRMNTGTVKVLLQLDTVKTFDSPILRSFVNSNISGAVTKFKTNLPVLTNNTLYFWRTSSVINNDTSDWSKAQALVYNIGTEFNDLKMRYINSEIPAELRKFENPQYNDPDFSNTSFKGDEIKLNEYSANLYVRSYGSNAEEASYFSVGNRNIFIDGGQNAGLNLIKVRKLNGSILEFKNLKMTSANSSDSILTFLNTFDSTHYLMLLNAAYVAGGLQMNAAAKAKFRQFGSIYCDSITLLGYFHTWSFIGFLGAVNSEVSEGYNSCNSLINGHPSCDHWSESISSKTVIFKNTSGSVSNIIGPARSWGSFSWEQILVPNSGLSFDVMGIDNNNNQVMLFPDVVTNKFSDLTKINAADYPFLNLIAKFKIDTSTGFQSPSLKTLKVNYSPGIELVLDKNSFINNSAGNVTKNINNTGFSFNYYNSGFAYINGIIINLFNKSISDSNLIFTDTLNSVFKTDSMRTYSNSFNTPRFTDSTRIYVYIKPKGGLKEFQTYNNSADFSLNSMNSISANSVEVYSDGKPLKNGDILSKKPEIKIEYSSNFTSPLNSDTSQLKIRLNGNYISYYSKGDINPLISSIESDKLSGSNKKTVLFYPELNNGNNKLSLVYKNNSDGSDTLNYDVIVSDQPGITDLYNFPNPMRSETNFIFSFTGSESFVKSKVKIYTVSGKIVREIDFGAGTGLNQIPWDGKDNDGDFIANGTYLYKIVIDNELNIETKIQKLVVLR